MSGEAVETLALAPRRAHQVGSLLWSVVPAVLFVIAGAAIHPWWFILLTLVFVPRAIIAVLRFRQYLRHRSATLIGPHGIVWPDGRTLDWADVGEIRVYRHSVLANLVRVLGQTPDDLIVLPTPTQVDFARRARSVPVGPRLHTAQLDTELDPLLAFLRGATRLPIVVRPTGSH